MDKMKLKLVALFSAALLCLHQGVANTKPLDDFKLRHLVVMTLWKEARGETPLGVQAVAEVIWNRAKHDKSKLQEVVLKPKQFSCWNKDKFDLRAALKVEELYGKTSAYRTCEALALKMVGGTFSSESAWNHYYNPKLCFPRWATPDKVKAGKVRFLLTIS